MRKKTLHRWWDGSEKRPMADADMREDDSSPIHKCPGQALQTQRPTFSHFDTQS